MRHRKDGSLTIPGAIVAVLMAAACAIFGAMAKDYIQLHISVALLEARCSP